MAGAPVLERIQDVGVGHGQATRQLDDCPRWRKRRETEGQTLPDHKQEHRGGGRTTGSWMPGAATTVAMIGRWEVD
jgi:hypothetical protein